MGDRLVIHSAKFENGVMDELMEGPGTIGDVALETGFNIETVRRVIRYLESKGLVEPCGISKGGNGRPVTRYQMARTRKAA